MIHYVIQTTRRLLLWSAIFVVLVACERQAAPPEEPTVAPTPISAAAVLERAQTQRTIGDHDQAAVEFRALLDTFPDAPEARIAQFYLAESFAQRGRWTSATEAFKTFSDNPHDDDLSARALFWLARGYEEAGDWANATATYARYRGLNTPLEPYAAMRQAAQLQAMGQLEEAAQTYEHAAAADINPSERAGSYEKAIALRRQRAQNDIALQLYTDLLTVAQNPAYRARILAEGAELAQSMGQTDTARAWQQEIVTDLPQTPQAVNAAQQLLADGDPALSAAAAARIFFTAERYAEALPLFDEAISQTLTSGADVGSDEAVLELQRLRAMAIRSLGDFPGALTALADISAASPDSEPGRQARLDWIQTLGQSGAVQEAADAYQEYARGYSDDPRAPVALDRSAQLLDRLGNTDAATLARLELGQRYPQDDLAPPALHTAGLSFFRARRWSEAQAAWQQLADNRADVEQARGAFWAARAAQQQQALDEARTLFTTAFEAAPDSYFGTRAADELALPMTPTITLGTPIDAEQWRALEAWVAAWSSQPVVSVVDQGYEPDVAESGFIVRAQALAEVGLGIEAIGEWNAARDIWADQPARLMQVARLAHESDMPYIALKGAEQLAVLAPEDAPPPPEALRRLIFPAPYLDLVLAETQSQNVDPRLFYALVRQESLFNPDATSWVGARGLAQVMPSTGEGIAQRLEVTDFQIDELYRPYVSIRFGTFYISQQIQNMNGSVHGGLAAYNGGLGNSQRWADGTTVGDPELFVEEIDYPETKNYVQRVYGHYGAYRRLYALP